MVHPDVVPEQYKPHWNSWEENKDAMILDQKGMLWFYGKLNATSIQAVLMTHRRSVQGRSKIAPAEPTSVARWTQNSAADLYPSMRVSTLYMS